MLKLLEKGWMMLGKILFTIILMMSPIIVGGLIFNLLGWEPILY